MRKGLKLPPGPPQDEVLSLGRVGSPKPHRPPTFHLGSAPATGTDREHPRACLHSIKALGWEAALAGACRRREQGREAGSEPGGPKGVLQGSTSPAQTNLGSMQCPSRGAERRARGSRRHSGVLGAVPKLPRASPTPHLGCQQMVEQPGSIPEQTLTSP